MEIIAAVVLGIVQGLTEFLPISSSGHLIIAQKLFGLEPDLFLNVALHAGTLFAVVIYYRKQIWQMIKSPFSVKSLLVIIATLPTVVIALAVKLFLPSVLDGILLPLGFAITFVLIVVSHHHSQEKHNLMTMKKKRALITGIVQGVAVLPGISRSGATICSMRLMGVKSKPAAEFSFLLSIPVILGSVIFMSAEAVITNATVDFLAVGIAVLVSAVVGFFALKFLLKLCEKGNFLPFAYYLVFPFLLSLLLLF